MADNSIRNNSPDTAKYHENIGGIPGTMIPRAGREGQSLAFDPNKPQTVIVDPGEAGGGFSLNLAELSKSKKQFNSAAVRNEVAEDVSSFYRTISEKLAEDNKPKPKPKPAAPITQSIEPPKEFTMPEALKPIAGLPPINLEATTAPPTAEAIRDTEAEIQQLMQVEREKAVLLLREQQARNAEVEAVAAPNYDKQMNEMRTNMNNQLAAVNALIGVVTELREERTLDVKGCPEKEEEVERVVEATLPTEIDPFEGLQIPFLQGSKPERPQYEIYFEMSKMGTMAARFHAVVVGKDCMALVYDTRFEDGFQYLPPNLGAEKVQVSVPKLGDTVYTCSSLGMHWTLGCLDVVILIRHTGDE